MKKPSLSFMVQENCFSYSFGRFPILSLCYMFKSYKILDKYEKNFFQYQNILLCKNTEKFILKFKKLAKKSIRFLLQKIKALYIQFIF